MNPKVDFYFTKAKQWQNEFILLREIALECNLAEELKWGHPCYMYHNSNVFLMHGFKNYCALLFFKGALLKDPKNILVQQTQNVQAARQLRFTNIKDIHKLKAIIKAYIFESVELEKNGLKVELKKTSEFNMPEEFKRKLSNSISLKKAFESLTPGRQRAYLLHFSQAKQVATRESRIEKCIPLIMSGKGLND